MGNRDKIIAYDLGTSGIKASLYDAAGRQLADTLSTYDTVYTGKKFHEQDQHHFGYIALQLSFQSAFFGHIFHLDENLKLNHDNHWDSIKNKLLQRMPQQSYLFEIKPN